MHKQSSTFRRVYPNWLAITFLGLLDLTFFIIFKNGYGTNKLTIYGYFTLTAIFALAIIFSTITVYLNNEYFLIKNGFGLINRKKVKLNEIISVEFFQGKMRFSPKAANLRDWRSFAIATFEKRGLLVRCINRFGFIISLSEIEELKNEIETRQSLKVK